MHARTLEAPATVGSSEVRELLKVERLTKKYGEHTAIADISFTVHEGEFVVLIGPSGAGKSTLLRSINRMIEPTSGHVRFDGMQVDALDKKGLRELRRKIGMIFQHYNLVDRLSVIENVLHGRLGYKSILTGSLGMYQAQEKERAMELITMLGLEEHTYKRADQLSGGQKQRVGIARALIQNPRLLLGDEPIASLDPKAAKTIMDYLKSIAHTLNISMIISLHQVQVALTYADRVLAVRQGRIVYDGLPRDLSLERVRDIYGADAGDLIIDTGDRHVD